VTFLIPSHAIAFKRRRFIIIIQSTYGKACGSLETIKKEFRENEWIKDIYRIEITRDREGEAVFRHPDGFETFVLCAGREQIGALRGRKFGAYRPDLIIIDDVEDDEMVKNPERRLDLKNNFNEVVMLLGERNKVQVFVIGTILHDDSLVANLVSKNDYKSFRKLLYKGLNQLKNGKLVSLWEYKWTVAELQKMARDNPAKFAKEIQNDPSVGLTQDIHREDFRYWYIEEGKYVLLDEFNRVMARGDLKTCKAAVACDLAWEERRENDFSVIMPGFITPQSDILIDDYICKKGLRPHEIEEILFSFDKRLRSITNSPVPFGFEKAKLEKIIQHLMRLAMRKRKQYLWFVDLEWDRDKITRIVTRLQPRYKQHIIYHKKGMGDLELQLTRLRSSAFDDLADAGQGLIQLLEYPKQPQKQITPQDEFMWWREQAIKFHQKNISKGNIKKPEYVFGNKNKRFEIPYTIGFR